MTTIDRLGIRGIRSYGPDQETFIKFYKPLTIILGRNGSGKSTIIEAVKMATTGDLPPMVERGAAFIHDPRIDNETETKAKIRLMFSNARGDQYIVSRHFQLTMKRGPRGNGYKTEFKTLDQTLKRMGRDDPGSASSYKCADINVLLPQVMGVAKPVLNNVIFVHQEDSLWPLSDPKTLKDKFDDIFAATRYTKALESIRKFKRDQTADLKTVKVELMHYEDKVVALEKVRSEVDEIRVRHDEFSKGIDVLRAEIAELVEQIRSVEQVTRKYQEKRSELDKLRVERARMEKDKAAKFAEMKVHLPEMDEEALRCEISDVQAYLDRADGERAKRSGVIEQLESELAMLRAECNERQSRKGMLEQQAKMHSNRLSRLEELKHELLTEERGRGTTTPVLHNVSLPDESASLLEWTSALQRRKEVTKRYVQKVLEKGDKSVSDATTKLNDAKLHVNTLQTDTRRKTDDIRAKRVKLSTIRKELVSLEASQSSVTSAENRVKTAQRLLDDITESTCVSELQKSILTNRRRTSTIREDLSELRSLREQLVADQNEQARYEILRETADKKKKILRTIQKDFIELMLSSIDELSPFLEGRGDLSSIREKLASPSSISLEQNRNEKEMIIEVSNRILASSRTAKTDIEKLAEKSTQALNSVNSRRAELQLQLNEVREYLDSQRVEMNSSARKLKEAPNSPAGIHEVAVLLEQLSISPTEEPRVLEEKHVDAVKNAIDKTDIEILKANQRISQLESGALLAEHELEQFEKDPKHKCPACGISSTKRYSDQLKHLLSRLERYKTPEPIQNTKLTLEKLQNTSQVLRKLQSQSSNAFLKGQSFRSVASKIREIDDEIEVLASKAKEARKRVRDFQHDAGENSATLQIPAKKLEFHQCFTESEMAKKEVETVRNGLSMNRAQSRSLKDVEKDIRQIEDEMTKLQELIEKDTRLVDREKEDLRRAEHRLHQSQQTLLQLNSMAEKHKRLALEEKEIKAEIGETEKGIQEDTSRTRQHQADVEYFEQELSVVRAESSNALKQANSLLSSREMQIQQWSTYVREVDAYERAGRRTELETLMMSLKNMQEDIESKDADKRAQEKELQTASDSQREMESRIRNLRDNQRYRLQEQELIVNARTMRHVKDEISAIERNTGMIPMEKLDKLRRMMNKKDSERHATLGKRQVYTDRYKEKKKELAVAEKAGSRRKFEECRIRKQTMELACSDLERYHRALDQALVAFHSLKMMAINRTIKELWQQTYMGTDIEEIEITSDSNTSRGTGTLTRSFQYRVQMRRGQATLDMRGRCSAGQKVLACLVIRLALAESFCSDCGILALDEPTTNLDRENIVSLAGALKAIIENRRQQRNFQLVLITHDQEFIEMIGAREFCSDYFRIVKDADGISRAHIEDLREMM
ncbi:DNA repair protein RAD50 [Gracilariopsis chorda]|uniref:DNA repair protein RAD50 n=1 Tax=Gracilariopsis chorda TaxID=448386 RepID=A0A2V3ITV5_9FLOR|nr:DNA repair protein RAD50 [Gracilariopsis chorda]|eukprot:PXF45529.1 DNA repair protein RAD50 [Gracilariopsis chorda]